MVDLLTSYLDYVFCLLLSAEYTFCSQNEQIHNFFKSFHVRSYIALKTMFHSWDSPILLVCDTGLYLEQNDISFITVAICGGYISKYPRLNPDTEMIHGRAWYFAVGWWRILLYEDP